MKKILLLSIALSFMGMELQAQTTDTLPCTRQRNYAYTAGWYDTCFWYLDPKGAESASPYHQYPDPTFHCSTGQAGPGVPIYMCYRHYTPEPLKIRGVWAMVSSSSNFPDPGRPGFPNASNVADSSKLPEYVYIHVRDTSVAIDSFYASSYLKRIATQRWDTLQPKKMCIQRFADGSPNPLGGGSFVYPDVYEILFDTVLTLEGEFWIAGSACNNYFNLRDYQYENLPTFYLEWGNLNHWQPILTRINQHNGPDGPWPGSEHWVHDPFFGPFGVITDYQWLVEVASDDTTQGSALHTAFYPDSSTQTITAIPRRGFKFSHWNDGNTDNPRSILVTQDTSFTAFFRPRSLHSVSLSSNCPFGVTSGDSIYFEGDSATIFAYSSDSSFFFSHWNDSVTDNPRSILVTQDTAFTAIFKSSQVSVDQPSPLLFSLNPNPSNGEVLLSLSQPLGSSATLTLRDAAGHELLVRSLPPNSTSLSLSLRHLPAGPYFLTLSSPQGSSTQKLIIQ